MLLAAMTVTGTMAMVMAIAMAATMILMILAMFATGMGQRLCARGVLRYTGGEGGGTGRGRGRGRGVEATVYAAWWKH